jgi:hypothetical protein
VNRRKLRGALTPGQCQALYHAWIEAPKLGRPLNRMVTVKPGGDLSPLDHAQLVDRFWNKVGGWSRYHVGGFFCLLVREKEPGGREHFHVLIHVPTAKVILFDKTIRGWFDEIDDINIKAANQRTFPLNVPGKLGSALGYISKQRTPEAAYRTIFLRRRGDSVLGKRARISRTLLASPTRLSTPVVPLIAAPVQQPEAA